jgi:hypothetical protein
MAIKYEKVTPATGTESLLLDMANSLRKIAGLPELKYEDGAFNVPTEVPDPEPLPEPETVAITEAEEPKPEKPKKAKKKKKGLSGRKKKKA